MDEMQDYEVNDILECLPYLERNDWERTRFLAYANCQINTKKKLKPNDILSFPWEKENKETEISNDDIKRLRKKAAEIKQIKKWQAII